MLEWVENTLKLFIATAPGNIIPLLVLDCYQCHMMSLVVSSIQHLDMEVEDIPGGCTSLCWPVDDGSNRSLKDNIGKDWEDWMLDLGMSISMTEPLTRKLIIE